MTDFFKNLRRQAAEPKMYSVVVKTPRTAILHMGVYYSLDEAFAAVKKRVMEMSKTKDPDKLNLDFWLWEVMSASSILAKFYGKDAQTIFLNEKMVEPHTTELSTGEKVESSIDNAEYVKRVYTMKNELMRRIIDTKDLKALAEATPLLSETEMQLIKEKIGPKSKTKKHDEIKQ